MLDLYLARHGATEWSRDGRHTGLTDLPLLPEGEAEARRLAARLRGIRFAAVYTSDLRRSRETAALAGFPDATPTPLLREYDYGDYEGLSSDQIRRDRPGWELFEDGCPGGETPAQVHERALSALKLLTAGEGSVLVFSHGHFLRALAAAWAGLAVAAARALALDTATLSILRDGDHGRVIQLWNDPS